MSWFKKPDPKEQARENARQMRKANRELESDRHDLDRREKQLEMEIKKLAKSGQQEACKVLAKQLIQLRAQRTRSHAMSAQLTGVQHQAKNMQAMSTMGSAVATTAKTMKTLNDAMPADKLAKTLREFQEEQTKMGISEELISDTMDAMMSEEGDEEAEQQILDSVLDEIGVEMRGKMASVPRNPLATTSEAASDEQINRLLEQLR